jgi:RAB protein geranylgeranyltransferase component A
MIHYSKVRIIKEEADEVGKEEGPFPKFLEEAFNLPSNLASQVAYAIAHCSSPMDSTLEALKRTRRYIKSIGRYGSGAFLVGQYGGAGEIAQGFCRYVPLYSLPALEIGEDGELMK